MLPGFLADSSLYASSTQYRGTSTAHDHGVRIEPQQSGFACAAACAICAGVLVAPELIVPEIACWACFSPACSSGVLSATQTPDTILKA